MKDLILRWFAWARAVLRADRSGCTGPDCRTADVRRIPRPPQPPAAEGPIPDRPDHLIDNRTTETMVWVTAHGIDIRPRRPYSRRPCHDRQDREAGH